MNVEELWVIRGSKPVLWTVPFWLTWEKGQMEATIFCAQPLIGIQEDAVSSVLRQSARPFNGMWRITRPDLERIGYQVNPPKRPELYLSWERTKEYQKLENKPELHEEVNDFIDALYQRGYGESRELVAYQWRQFCNHMQHWLLVKEKPVDLGFMKLHPSSYRQNWMLVVLSRFPKLGQAISHLSEPELSYILHKSGFMEALLSLDLLAVNNRWEYCYRQVEVEMTKHWWKSVELVERNRIKNLGRFNYANHVMDSVRRGLKGTIQRYRRWLAHIARPSGRHVPGIKAGAFRIIARKGNPRRQIHGAEKFLDAVVPNKLPAFTAASLSQGVFEAPETMPTLPDLQPPVAQLRTDRRDVSEYDDWQI